MKKMKRLMSIMLWALVAIMGTSQAFAGTGEIAGITVLGPSETAGIVAAILDHLVLFF